MKSQPKNY